MRFAFSAFRQALLLRWRLRRRAIAVRFAVVSVMCGCCRGLFIFSSFPFPFWAETV